MRPKSIVQAERLYLVSAVLILVGAALDWSALVEMGGLALAAGSAATLLGAFLLMTLFATRRGSRVARALLVVLAVVSAASMVWQTASGQVALGPAGVVNILQLLLLVVATVLLFRPNASSWFARSHPEWEQDA